MANADPQDLATRWQAFAPHPDVRVVRKPESALVMVQARIGGSGRRFNLGEATVCRATVVVDHDGESSMGTATVLGSRPGHAEVAAVVDGALGSTLGERVMAEVVAPLESTLAATDTRRRAKARSTVVDFFTVAREHGDDDEDDE